MGPESFVLVIGSGAAGTACARRLAKAGVHVAVVEDGKVGGTCIWHGCMPKKALYHAARAYLGAAKDEECGVMCGGRHLDWESVLAWKWHSQESYAGDQEASFVERGIELVRGTARFEAPLKVRVDGRLLEPSDVVIACGSTPVIPPIPGAETADTSEEALHYPCRPESLIVVGGGDIAAEFAGIYAAFGTRVTVVVRGELLKHVDREFVSIARRRLESMGVAFRFGVVPDRIACGETGSRVVLQGGEELVGERVLLATGRRSLAPELDLEAGGLAVDDRGRLRLDPLGRTSDPHVWTAGDARGGAMHTPLADAEGRHVAETMLGLAHEPLDTSAMPTAVFTFPQLAQAGMTEEQARTAGVDYVVHRERLDLVGAAIIADERDGLVKVLATPDERVLGAHIAAPHAADLVYAYAVAIEGGLSLGDVRATPAVHPSLSQAAEFVAW